MRRMEVSLPRPSIEDHSKEFDITIGGLCRKIVNRFGSFMFIPDGDYLKNLDVRSKVDLEYLQLCRYILDKESYIIEATFEAAKFG